MLKALEKLHTNQQAYDERGASLVEYAFLVALIAVVAIGAVTVAGGEVGEILEESETEISTGISNAQTP